MDSRHVCHGRQTRRSKRLSFSCCHLTSKLLASASWTGQDCKHGWALVLTHAADGSTCKITLASEVRAPVLDTPCDVACLEIALQATPQAQMLCLQLYVRGLQGSHLQAGPNWFPGLARDESSCCRQTRRRLGKQNLYACYLDSLFITHAERAATPTALSRPFVAHGGLLHVCTCCMLSNPHCKTAAHIYAMQHWMLFRTCGTRTTQIAVLQPAKLSSQYNCSPVLPNDTPSIQDAVIREAPTNHWQGNTPVLLHEKQDASLNGIGMVSVCRLLACWLLSWMSCLTCLPAAILI